MVLTVCFLGQTMSMLAAGTYIKTLREAKQLSRADLAKQSETNEMQILRVEKGEIDTRGSLLMKIVRVVEGSAEHIADLMLNDNATAEDAKKLAVIHLQSPKTSTSQKTASKTAIAAFLRGLRNIKRDSYYENGTQLGYEYLFRELSDEYIDQIDRNEIDLTEVALHLFRLEASQEEIDLVIENPDLSANMGARLALTRVGIGDTEKLIKSIRENLSSNSAT
jgi:transcriptional regulator with XRE-family HTH domain